MGGIGRIPIFREVIGRSFHRSVNGIEGEVEQQRLRRVAIQNARHRRVRQQVRGIAVVALCVRVLGRVRIGILRAVQPPVGFVRLQVIGGPMRKGIDHAILAVM